MQTPKPKPIIGNLGTFMRGFVYAFIAAAHSILNHADAAKYIDPAILFWLNPMVDVALVYRAYLDLSPAINKGMTTDADPPYEGPPPARFQPDARAVAEIEQSKLEDGSS